MPTLAIEVTENEKVRRYFATLNKKLRGMEFANLLFKGGTRRIQQNIYVVDVQPMIPRLVVNMFALFLAVGGFLGYYFGFTWVAYVAIPIAAFVALFWNALFSKAWYVFFFSIQVSRMTGKWRLGKEVSEKVLRERLL